MKKKHKLVLVGLTVALLTLFKLNAVIIYDTFGEFTREDNARFALENGVLFPCVGTAVGDKDGKLVFAGSVVAISDNIAISAEHASLIKTGPRKGQSYDAIHVVFGENSKEEVKAERMYTTIDVIRHEALDIVVYVFEDGALADIEKANISFEAPQIGDMVYHAGMGFFAHLGDEELVWDGYRRAVKAEIDSFGYSDVGNDHLVTWMSGVTAFALPHGGRAANGDSGGGTFIRRSDGSFELVGMVRKVYGEKIDSGFTASLMYGAPEVQEFLLPFLETEPTLADNEDADGDGVINLTELALGTDPYDYTSYPRPVIRVSGSDLVYNYLRLDGGEVINGNYEVDGVCYVGEASGDLDNWASAQSCEPSLDLPDARVGYEWSAVCLPTTGKSGFLRINVTRSDSKN